MIRRTLMVAAGTLAAAAGASAQLSPWYVTEGNGGLGNTHVMQGGAQQFQYPWMTDGQIPIYVSGTVRQANYQGGGLRGDEYTLGGSPTNFQNYWSNNFINSYDAAFDGTNVYTVDWTSGQVQRWDANYANGAPLFQANPGDLGITYDGSNLWTSNWFDGRVTKWAMNGTPLASFNPGMGGESALAWDPIDSTLWMAVGGSFAIQMDPNSGSVMQSYQLPAYVLGGEMAIPAPGAAALAAAGGLLAMRRRR